MKNLITIFFIALTALSFGQIDRSKAPKAQPNPEINIPTPKIVELDNGLKVIIVENHKLPKVSFQLFIDNPPMMENDKVGISDFLGDMLGSGTADYSKSEFDETVDFIGASFFPNGNGFFASSLTKHSDKLLTLLKSVINSPSFPESEFERIKNQYLSGLSANKSDPNSMASNAGNVINYGKNHPYGEIMTEASVNNITIEDIKNHYNTSFKPNNAYLVIVGDVTEDKAKTLANTYFGDWKATQYPIKATQTTTPNNNGNQVYFIDKPGAVQSVIKITNTIDLVPGHPDEIKLSILNSILGGGSFSARLMSNLREDKAYTYGCYSRVESDKLKGEFSAGGSFRNEVTDSSIIQILFEIDRISKEPVTADELDLVKKSRTGAFARSLENPQTIARFALNTIRYNLPSNYYANYLKQIESVTAADLLSVSKKYLKPNNLNIIVVGNEEIAESLLPFDADSKITYKNGFGEDKITLKPVETGVTSETILNNFIHKVYLTDSDKVINKKNKKTKYIHKQFIGTMPQAGMSFDLISANASPNKEAVLIKSGPTVIQKEYFNGTVGKSESMQGNKDFSEQEIKEKSLTTFPFAQLYYLNSDIYTVTLLGIDNMESKDYYKLEVKNSVSEELAYEFYSVESGLLEYKETMKTNDEGELMQTTIKLTDYKTYGKGSRSMLFSSKQSMNNNGNIIDLDLKTVTLSKKYPN